jgi:carboxylate-amine ligase
VSRALGLFEAFGVELEYMIVDRDTLTIRPIADRLLRDGAGRVVSQVERGPIAWSNELVLHVIELKTNGPRRSLEGLEGELHENVRAIDALLEPSGARLLPTGAHPLMDPLTESRLWPHEYNAVYESYDRIFDCRGHGWSNLQSVHLNLPFAGDEEFGRLHAAVRLLLPILPALSASTPLLEGKVTGLRDTRLEVYRRNQERVPSITGQVVPERAFTRREYRERILEPLYEDIAPLDPGGLLRHEWLNSRGAIARFERSTIEIRLLDIQECPAADLAILRAVVAALETLVADTWAPGGRQREMATEELAALLLETIRGGEQALLANPRYLALFGLDAPQATAGALWRHILAGAGAGMAGGPVLRTVLERGTLATRILEALGPAPSREAILDVYRRLAGCLAENRLFLP